MTNAPVGSDEDRGQVLLLIMRHLPWPGKRAIRSNWWLIRDVAHAELGSIYLTNQMQATSRLKADPETWGRLVPYLRPDCPAVRIS